MPRYWLMKSEPDVYSFDDLMAEPRGSEPWDGVRNYRARNYMREMKVGDRVLFYHSSCQPPHVAGIAEVCREAYPDFTAWDPESRYHDERSTPDKPVWEMVDVKAVEKLPAIVPLQDLKDNPALAEMKVVQRGQRLSIMPVTEEEFREVRAMARAAAEE